MILSVLEDGKIKERKAMGTVFHHSCDVLCMGAGSAGIYAALSADSCGADVILCELGANIGGMHVCGNVTGFYYGAEGGAYEEEYQKCCRDTIFLTAGKHWEQRQIHITDRLRKSGVRLLCRHGATGIYFEGSRAVGLRVFDGEKEVNIKAKIIIDATSDGHLVRMCRVKKEYGRPTDGMNVPFTVRAQFVKEGRLCSNNEDSGFTDQYDKSDFSEKTILAHAGAARFLSRGEFVNVALHTGVREGLIFQGEESVLYRDILLEKKPEKILFYAYSDLDRHGNDRSVEEELFQNWWVISNLATVTVNIPVPMGSVVPKGIKGLVTAGRCLSCDTYSQSAVRMNRDMFRMGECVGVAAAMSAASGMDFMEIDYETYRAEVRKRGCFAEVETRTFGFDNTYQMYCRKMNALKRSCDPEYASLSPTDRIYVPIVFDFEKNLPLLKTDAPGIAIWSAYLAKDRAFARERLHGEMLRAGTKQHRYHCSIALGLLEDERALPVLREIVDRRDHFFFTDNRRSNQFRSVSAICLLGRFGKQEDLDRLFAILSEEEIHREMYHALPPDYLYHTKDDRNFVYFYMLTHACTAILKIYQKSGLPKEALHAFFTDFFAGDKVLRRVTHTNPGEPAYDEMKSFIAHMLRATEN